MNVTLRTRILIALLVAFAVLGTTTFIVYQQILLPRFLDLERRHIKANVLRVSQALENELQNLNIFANDWSEWDDTYAYINDHNAGYETSNLPDSTFSIARINLFYFLDKAGRVVWGKAMGEDFESPLIVQPFDQEQFSADFPLLQHHAQAIALGHKDFSGLTRTSAGLMLVVARAIVPSNDDKPSQGTLIMGRLLSPEVNQKISRLTGVVYEAHPVSRKDQRLDFGTLSTLRRPGDVTYQSSEDDITASTVYTDLAGSPILELKVIEPREIFRQGVRTLRIALLYMFCGVAVALCFMMLLLQRSVIAPVFKITRSIVENRQSEHTWSVIELGNSASSELSLLATEYNQLMESLQSKSQKLSEAYFNLMQDAKKLKDAEKTLRSLDQLKSEFISTAAHELRTPIASIMGYLELLTDKELSISFNAEQKEDFQQEIYENCERLTKIIDDILDVSRIEAGQSIPLEKSPASPETLLVKIVQRFKIKAKHRIHLEINPDIPRVVELDTHRITQVIDNLLSNAIKYSPVGSDIRVTAERDGRCCKISIRDQGIGMNAEQAARIFDKFYRADATDTAVRGLGLGMSIVKQIVEDHGGTIWVESTFGKGTMVYFTLPAATLDQ